MEHKHKWVETMWYLIGPYGPCNQPNRYLSVEICRYCGTLRVAPSDRKKIMEGMEDD